MGATTPVLSKREFRKQVILNDLRVAGDRGEFPSKANLADYGGHLPTRTHQGHVRMIEDMMGRGLIENTETRPMRYALRLTELGRREVAYWNDNESED